MAPAAAERARCCRCWPACWWQTRAASPCSGTTGPHCRALHATAPRRARGLHLPAVQPAAVPQRARQRAAALPLLGATHGTGVARWRGAGARRAARAEWASGCHLCGIARRCSCRSASNSAWPPRVRSSVIPEIVIADEPTSALDEDRRESPSSRAAVGLARTNPQRARLREP